MHAVIAHTTMCVCVSWHTEIWVLDDVLWIPRPAGLYKIVFSLLNGLVFENNLCRYYDGSISM